MAHVRPPTKSWTPFRRRALVVGAAAGCLWAWTTAGPDPGGRSPSRTWLLGIGLGAAAGLAAALLFQHLCRLLYRLFRPRMRPDRLS